MTEKEKLIKACECIRDLLPDNRCKDCPYGYGYIDTYGDNAFWWCDSGRLMEDMYKYIKKEDN